MQAGIARAKIRGGLQPSDRGNINVAPSGSGSLVIGVSMEGSIASMETAGYPGSRRKAPADMAGSGLHRPGPTVFLLRNGQGSTAGEHDCCTASPVRIVIQSVWHRLMLPADIAGVAVQAEEAEG